MSTMFRWLLVGVAVATLAACSQAEEGDEADGIAVDLAAQDMVSAGQDVHDAGLEDGAASEVSGFDDVGPFVDAPNDTGSTAADVAPTDTNPAELIKCNKPSYCTKFKPTPICDLVTGYCVQCLIDMHCIYRSPSKPTCTNKVCTKWGKNEPCKPGSTLCGGKHVLMVCGKDSQWQPQLCPEIAPVCIAGQCRDCVANQPYCAKPEAGQPSKALMKCDATGKGSLLKVCGAKELCVNGQCVMCPPGNFTCDGDKAMVCNAAGSQLSLKEDCAKTGNVCVAGTCVDPCKSPTGSICVRAAVDLDMAALPIPGQTSKTAAGLPVEALLSNPSSSDGTILATAASGQTHKDTIKAGKGLTMQLPVAAWNLPAWSQDGSTINNYSARVDVGKHTTMHLHKRSVGVAPRTAAMALSFPMALLGKKYWIVAGDHPWPKMRSFVTIVAVESGLTSLQLVPSTKLLSGGGMGQSIPAPSSYKLTKGQVLTVESDVLGGGLTGSFVMASNPIAVFAGGEAATVPRTNRCVKQAGKVKGACATKGWACATDADCPRTCCEDAVHEQLLPVSRWGTIYPLAAFAPRGKAKDTWTVIAAHSNTIVQTFPQVATIPPLNQGQAYSFDASGMFVLKANKPVMVAHAMSGKAAPDANPDMCAPGAANVCMWHHSNKVSTKPCKHHVDCPNIPQADDAKVGGPALSIAMPPTLHAKSHAFTVPEGYDKAWVTIICEKGDVAVDGKKIAAAAWQTIPSQPWKVARVAMKPGTHVVKADDPCGAEIHGWNADAGWATTAAVGGW